MNPYDDIRHFSKEELPAAGNRGYKADHHVQDPATALHSHEITYPYTFDTPQAKFAIPRTLYQLYAALPVLPPADGRISLGHRYVSSVSEWQFLNNRLVCEDDFRITSNKQSISPFRIRDLVLNGGSDQGQQDWGRTAEGGSKYGLFLLDEELRVCGLKDFEHPRYSTTVMRRNIVKHIEIDVMVEHRKNVIAAEETAAADMENLTDEENLNRPGAFQKFILGLKRAVPKKPSKPSKPTKSLRPAKSMVSLRLPKSKAPMKTMKSESMVFVKPAQSMASMNDLSFSSNRGQTMIASPRFS